MSSMLPEMDFEPDARGIDDVDATRQAIFDNVYNSVSKNFAGDWSPTRSPYSLRVTNLAWDSDKPMSLTDQKSAILGRKTLGRKLKGTWELVDKATGEVADRKSTTLAKVPYMTQRGTFIYNGREYSLANQMRLRSGVYTRKTADGEYESHFNLLPRTGTSFRVKMRPDTGAFSLKVGQGSVPLYPVLKAMGIDDQTLKRSWGDHMYTVNKTEDGHKGANKAYDKLVGGDAEDKVAGLREHLGKMRLDPEIVKRTLGRYLNDEKQLEDPGQLLLASTKKLIGVNRGDDDVDPRDDLGNQVIMGPEDYFAERIEKDARKVAGSILWASSQKGKLAKVKAGLLDQQLSNVLLNSGLGSMLEETNMLETVDAQHRITKLGTGGVMSTDAVTDDMRAVQPTYLGFVDPFRSTECYTADMEVLGKRKWLRWDEVTEDTELATLVNGAKVYMKPIGIHVYAHSGYVEMYEDDRIAYAVTMNHRMWVASGPEDEFHYDYATDVRGSDMFMLLADGSRHQLSTGGYSEARYEGKVYCATMPTGLLIVRRPGRSGTGFVCGNSAKVGVDNRLTQGVRKGRDGQLYRQLSDARTGKSRWVSMVDAGKATVAFPGEMESDEPLIRAVSGGELAYVPREEVDYALPNHDDMLDNGVNLVPFVNATQGNRLMLAGKMLMQAVSLKDREAPLVRNLSSKGDTFESRMGSRLGAVRADQPGMVTRVTPDSITIMQRDGTTRDIELYNNFPLNRKSYFSSKPLVTPGQEVNPGDLLASSNYTDDKGDLALGRHLRTAFIPFKGLSNEDAFVISESAAAKLGHEAMYTTDFDAEPGMHTGMNKFISTFPGIYKKDQLGNLDDNGVVKPGSTLRKGDPLVLVVGDPQARGEGQRGPGSKRPLNKTITWEHDYEGVVTDAVVGDDGGIRVATRAYVPMQEGDKISGLHGDKGVVRVIPDAQMPTDADGNPYELLQNPLTLPTRKNNAQVYSMLLSKIARKTGKPYDLEKFHKGSVAEFVRDELRKHGFNEDGYESVFDPETGRDIKDVLAGEKYIMKLHHTAESKSGGRDIGSYTAEGVPARGGYDGAKAMSNLGLNAMLAHGATKNIADMKQFKSSRNDEFWREFRLGRTPPAPKESFVYGKMMAHLKAAGVNLQRRGDYQHLTAMTDKDVDEITGDRVVNSPETLDEASMQPIKGGLFDRALFGGVGGNKWARIDLPEPMPSPVMEDSIKLLLGMTNKDYEETLSGGNPGGKPGGAIIQDKLSQINLDEAIAREKANVESGSRTARDKAIKRLRILSSAKEAGIHPKDWVISKVPVLPAEFRPISKMSNGVGLVTDANMLYQDLLMNSQALKDNVGLLGNAGTREERLNTYKALKAVTGLGDPVHPKLQEKGVAGALRHVFGKNSPKFGMFQRRVIGMNLDKSGRGVIAPDPDLNMDEIGIPEDSAWDMYKSFIMRRMVRSGVSPVDAARRIDEKSSDAKDILLKEMDERPVLYTRAPALSKFGIMASKPVLVTGKTIRMSPLIMSGIVGDFDGDAVSTHVPVSKDAVDEAYEKLLPSKNLFDLKTFSPIYKPSNEFALGLYNLTAPKKKQDGKAKGDPIRFRSLEDMLKALKRGEIKRSAEVVID